MRRVRRTSALAVFLAAAVAGWALSDLVLRHRGSVPVLTPWGAVAALVISGAVLVCGLAVRRLRSRERTWMTPTAAATTAAAAQASALVGAVVGGVYAGQLLLALLSPHPGNEPPGLDGGSLPPGLPPVVRGRFSGRALVRHLR
ncbi:DUF3180 family protein [Actinomyces lilanjuaniae]|uniref:DUF3180 family protein n=1 Tax=Actinomyces lilanjuaniae TaxID=2321394 RepID=UPI001FAA5147|nr:DUF3180 family protein [Actinomyces lilanjuaniae]